MVWGRKNKTFSFCRWFGSICKNNNDNLNFCLSESLTLSNLIVHCIVRYTNVKLHTRLDCVVVNTCVNAICIENFSFNFLHFLYHMKEINLIENVIDLLSFRAWMHSMSTAIYNRRFDNVCFLSTIGLNLKGEIKQHSRLKQSVCVLCSFSVVSLCLTSQSFRHFFSAHTKHKLPLIGNDKWSFFVVPLIYFFLLFFRFVQIHLILRIRQLIFLAFC